MQRYHFMILILYTIIKNEIFILFLRCGYNFAKQFLGIFLFDFIFNIILQLSKIEKLEPYRVQIFFSVWCSSAPLIPLTAGVTGRYTDRYTHTDRCTRTDRLIDIQTDRLTGRHTHRQTNRYTDRQTDRCTDRQIHRQTDIIKVLWAFW